MAKKLQNTVRLIGGTLRRRHLHFPSIAGLRPTTDRIRETLFNWLGQDLTGKRCLDLFAGSGALGFEAASRHAAAVTMVDSAKPVVQALQQNCALLQVQNIITIHHQLAVGFLANDRMRYDIIFLDPPFASNPWPTILPLLPDHLTSQGLVYIEAAQLPTLKAGQWLKRAKAGDVQFGLVTFNNIFTRL